MNKLRDWGVSGDMREVARPPTVPELPSETSDRISSPWAGAIFVAPGPGGETTGSRSTALTLRTQVVAVYLLLLVVAGVLIVAGVRQALTIRLSHRIEEDLQQEVEEVTWLVRNGNDPLTGRPFESLSRAFDVYLNRNVPNLEEAFLAFIDGEIHGERIDRFPGRSIPSSAREELASLSTGAGGPDAVDGEFTTDEGSARYRAVHLRLGEEQGVFVVAILPRAEKEEIRELETYGAGVAAAIVLLAAVAAWFLAGLVLAPVRDLTLTARSVSEASRAGRIPVTGTRETMAMAQSVNAMLDRLDAAHKSQLEFLRATGHELRTPLTVGMGHLSLVDPGNVEQVRATMVIVLDELSRMGRIVDDLQSLAESEHPTFVVRRPFELDQFVIDLVTKSRALGDRVWVLDEITEGVLVADRDRLVEAMLNLTDNAVKNSDPGATIGIGVAVSETEVRLSVRDTGTGISDDDQRLMFQRFVRGSHASHRYRGVGLGLAVVQTIVEGHGGRVEVESQEGVGSRFTLVIPRESS